MLFSSGNYDCGDGSEGQLVHMFKSIQNHDQAVLGIINEMLADAATRKPRAYVIFRFCKTANVTFTNEHLNTPVMLSDI